MIVKTEKKLGSFMILLFALTFIAGVVLAGPTHSYSKTADEDDNKEFLNYLRELDMVSNQIERGAVELDTFIRRHTEFTWESHAAEWRYITDDLEKMTGYVEKLRNLKDAEVWQKTLIKEIATATAALTDQADKILDDLEEQSKMEFAQNEYKARVAAVHTYADRIDDFAKYGKIRCELEGM